MIKFVQTKYKINNAVLFLKLFHIQSKEYYCMKKTERKENLKNGERSNAMKFGLV